MAVTKRFGQLTGEWRRIERVVGKVDPTVMVEWHGEWRGHTTATVTEFQGHYAVMVDGQEYSAPFNGEQQDGPTMYDYMVDLAKGLEAAYQGEVMMFDFLDSGRG